jgi:tetratricopeptide (TPR) repeat protein
MENAERYFQESRTLSAKLGNPLELANAEYNLGVLYLHRGDFAQATAAAEHALALDEGLGHIALMTRTYLLLGACYQAQGELTRAEPFYQRATEMSRNLGDQSGIAIGLTNLAELAGERGEFDQACSFYEQALRAFEALGHESSLGYVLVGLGDLEYRQALGTDESAARSTHLQSAEEHIAHALRITRKMGAAPREGIAERVLANIYHARGDLRAAQTHARRAVELLEAGGMALELQRALRTYADILNASSDPQDHEEAARLLDQAAAAR